MQNGLRVDIIEVKSGRDYKIHKALDNVLGVNEWNFDAAYVLCQGNTATEGDVTYLPWYMAMFLRPVQTPKGLTCKVDISELDA